MVRWKNPIKMLEEKADEELLFMDKLISIIENSRNKALEIKQDVDGEIHRLEQVKEKCRRVEEFTSNLLQHKK